MVLETSYQSVPRFILYSRINEARPPVLFFKVLRKGCEGFRLKPQLSKTSAGLAVRPFFQVSSSIFQQLTCKFTAIAPPPYNIGYLRYLLKVRSHGILMGHICCWFNKYRYILRRNFADFSFFYRYLCIDAVPRF